MLKADIEKQLGPDSRKAMKETFELMEAMKVIKPEETSDGECVKFTCELYRRYFRRVTDQGDINPTDQRLVKIGSEPPKVINTAQMTDDDWL